MESKFDFTLRAQNVLSYYNCLKVFFNYHPKLMMCGSILIILVHLLEYTEHSYKTY